MAFTVAVMHRPRPQAYIFAGGPPPVTEAYILIGWHWLVYEGNMNVLVAESCNLGSLTGDDLREGERSPKTPDSPALDLV